MLDALVDGGALADALAVRLQCACAALPRDVRRRVAVDLALDRHVAAERHLCGVAAVGDDARGAGELRRVELHPVDAGDAARSGARRRVAGESPTPVRRHRRRAAAAAAAVVAAAGEPAPQPAQATVAHPRVVVDAERVQRGW